MRNIIWFFVLKYKVYYNKKSKSKSITWGLAFTVNLRNRLWAGGSPLAGFPQHILELWSCNCITYPLNQTVLTQYIIWPEEIFWKVFVFSVWVTTNQIQIIARLRLHKLLSQRRKSILCHLVTIGEVSYFISSWGWVSLK